MNKRESFSGKLGFVLSCIGSAIGLGNIWMFSWRLGEYGGAAFLVPYLLFVFLLGSIGLIGEFSLGRCMKKGSYSGIKEILEKKNIPFKNIISTIPTIGLLGILIFYSIVVGWILRYFYGALVGDFKTVNIPDYFNNFAGTSSSIIWHGLAIFITLAIVSFGITKGIEKLNKVIMPALFGIFILLMIRSLTLEGAMEGVKYLLIPDWSYLLKPITWIMALGQAFFTVSLTGSALVVYGSYLKDDVDIPSSALHIIIFDTLSALLAAFIIIPAAFAFGLDPSAGPSLLFITVPAIFKSMAFGQFFSVLFFLSIIFASISSAINMMEAPAEALMNRFNLSRFKSVLIIGLIAFIAGIPLDLSMNSFGKFSDFITIYISPLGAVIAGIVFYWVYGSDNAISEINKGAKYLLGKWFHPLGKYFFTFVSIIVLILGILYNGIG